MPSPQVQYCSLLGEGNQVWRGRCWKNLCALEIVSQCSPTVCTVDTGPGCGNVKTGGTCKRPDQGGKCSSLWCDISHMQVPLPPWSYSPWHTHRNNQRRPRHSQDPNTNTLLSSNSETEVSREVGPVHQQAGLVFPSNQGPLISTV